MIKVILTAVTVAILAAGCANGATNNAVSVSPPATNEVVRLVWDSNAVHTIFLWEGVIRMADAGHKNEIWLYTTNRVYVIPDAINHWKDVQAFREEAEKGVKRIPILFLD